MDNVGEPMSCKNCKDEKALFAPHCVNPACNWIRCLSCSKADVIRKEGV